MSLLIITKILLKVTPVRGSFNLGSFVIKSKVINDQALFNIARDYSFPYN